MSLIAKNLAVTLGGRAVLSDLSLEAGRGAFLIVVGPNGAGKTSLLKAIAGLAPSSGQLDWDGQPLGSMSAAARAKILAFLPQGHVAHWPLIARDVVAIGRAPFASSLAKLSSSDSAAVDAAIAAVGAASFASRPVTELSGGERARIMLARALAVGAPMLLADEPVASLDPAHQLAVMDLLAAESKRDRLVIAVSHDLLLAARYADLVLVLAGGKPVAFGPPAETLTAKLLREVFEVETIRVDAPGLSVDIPWSLHRGV